MSHEKTITRIIEREGGYVDDADDRGGCTNMGITIDTLAEWRGADVTCAEVRELPEEEARAIYRQRYVVDPGYEQIEDDALQELMIDSGVQHGPPRATRWLQAAAGATVDGIFGPRTAEAVHNAPADQLYRSILRRRMRWYGAIIEADHTQARFARGWMSRLAEFISKEDAA